VPTTKVNDNESVSGFCCILVLSACVPASVLVCFVVLGRYWSQLGVPLC